MAGPVAMLSMAAVFWMATISIVVAMHPEEPSHPIDIGDFSMHERQPLAPSGPLNRGGKNPLSRLSVLHEHLKAAGEAHVEAQRRKDGQPVELGDEDQLGASNEARATDRVGKSAIAAKIAAQELVRKKQLLEVSLMDEEKALGRLAPEVRREQALTSSHKRLRDVSLNAVRKAVTETKDIQRKVNNLPLQPVVVAEDEDPVVAKVSQEAVAEQTEIKASLQKQKEELDRTQKFGQALKAAEDVGQKNEEAQSYIGLNAKQQEIPWLTGLDSAVKGALEQPTGQRVREAQDALQRAALQFRAYQDAKESGNKQAEKEEEQRAHRKAIQQAQKVATDEEAELKSKEDTSKKFEGRERQEKVAWAAKVAAQKKSMLNQALKQAAAERQQKNSEFEMTLGDKTVTFKRSKVSGLLDGPGMHEACAEAGMLPVCNSYKIFNGQCFPVVDGSQEWSFTDTAAAGARGIPEEKLKGVWFYNAGVGMGMGVQNSGTVVVEVDGKNVTKAAQHVTANPASNKNGDAETYCVRPDPHDSNQFKWGAFMGIYAPIKGIVTNKAIQEACANHEGVRLSHNETLKVKPVCDSYLVEGGTDCVLMPEGMDMVFSDPEKMASHDIFRKTGAFTYYYGSDIPNLNYLSGSRSANSKDKGGKTLCGVVQESWIISHSKISVVGHDLVKAPFVGEANATNLDQACRELDLKPVCAGYSAFDGGCILITPGKQDWSLSSPEGVKYVASNLDSIAGTYFYTGKNRRSSSEYNTGCCGMRQSNAQNGHTWCSKWTPADMYYEQHHVRSVEVRGKMNNVAAGKACASIGTKPEYFDVVKPRVDSSSSAAVMRAKCAGDLECEWIGKDSEGSWWYLKKSLDEDSRYRQNTPCSSKAGDHEGQILKPDPPRLSGTTDEARDAECCKLCKSNTQCEVWVRTGDGSYCTLKSHAGKPVTLRSSGNQNTRYGTLPFAQKTKVDFPLALINAKGSCTATHEDMEGVTIKTIKYAGASDEEKDASCCNHCKDDMECQFWVREVESDACMLKKSYEKSNKVKAPTASSKRRGGAVRIPPITGYKPVCDSGEIYFTGKGGCIPFEPVAGANIWKWSDPVSNIHRNIDADQLIGNFMWTANDTAVGRTVPLNINMGSSSVPMDGSVPYVNGLTVCAKSETNYPSPITIEGKRVQSIVLPHDKASSADIISACDQEGLAPVCSQNAYNDGMCTMILPMDKDARWNIDSYTQRLNHGVESSSVLHTSVYAGLTNNFNSLFLTNGPPIWSRVGMRALCTDKFVPKIKQLVNIPVDYTYNSIQNWTMVPCKVQGYMTGANAVECCKSLKPSFVEYKPVCDSPQEANDRHCTPIMIKGGGTRFFSSIAPDPPQLASIGVFFYKGLKMPMKLSTGTRELSVRSQWQKNQYTYCAAANGRHCKQGELCNYLPLGQWVAIKSVEQPYGTTLANGNQGVGNFGKAGCILEAVTQRASDLGCKGFPDCVSKVNKAEGQQLTGVVCKDASAGLQKSDIEYNQKWKLEYISEDQFALRAQLSNKVCIQDSKAGKRVTCDSGLLDGVQKSETFIASLTSSGKLAIKGGELNKYCGFTNFGAGPTFTCESNTPQNTFEMIVVQQDPNPDLA